MRLISTAHAGTDKFRPDPPRPRILRQPGQTVNLNTAGASPQPYQRDRRRQQPNAPAANYSV